MRILNFCGFYDPLEGEFFELESNMAGRRHSASVFLDGEIYAYGGSPNLKGFNGNALILFYQVQKGVILKSMGMSGLQKAL
ncbi:MAG: hypothetical protein Ct9H300mP2_2590 [Candidatus Neomarinimicrobiota bacterium]|nr:MAG: hypothetical protein Ct9H300mP2_2590 [Candidatus Neomarinimicrobiota bacterium]